MFEYLDNLRNKPHHIRRRVAVGTAAGVTALVAIGWAVVLSTSGVLNLSAPTLSQGDVNGLNNAVAQTKSSFNNLAGAAAAQYAAQGASGASGVTVVTQSTTTVSKAPTTIPF